MEQKTVPCETCGEPTIYTGTKRCNNCYEVESRLDSYLRNPKAWQFIVKKIHEGELKQGAAKAIEICDEDELERYSSELRAARLAVIEGHVEDVHGWVTQNDLDELRAFLNSALNIDQMTLGEIKTRFETYLEDPDPDEQIPYVPVTAGSRFRSDRPNIANGPKSLWSNDKIQFARLLCEIRAACEMEGFDQVMESMDLDDEQIDELWKRAEAVWEESKAEHCPPPVARSSRMPECPCCYDIALVQDGNDMSGTVHCPKCSTVFQSVKVRCDDCDWSGLECELIVKLDLISPSRLDVGGEVPAGQCPKCGALAYLEREANKIIPHIKHISHLEVAWYGRAHDPDSVTVECTKCGEVVAELFNADFEGARIDKTAV